MEITKIAISNFRSIGKDPIAIPLGKITILIGQNNAGKSNIIKALQKIKSINSRNLPNNMPLVMDSLDYHNRHAEISFTFTCYIKAPDLDKLSSYQGEHFITYEVGGNNVFATDTSFIQVDWQQQDILLQKWFNSRYRGRPSPDESKKEMLKIAGLYLSEIINAIPAIHLIPQFRQILPAEKYSLDGKNLIATLGEFQHPPLGHEQKKDKFIKIQELMRRLIHLAEAKLEVSHTNDSIFIENHGLRLPLESYGTGVHQLIILATALETHENVLFCLEEPEIHLHPKLQKEFLEFLEKETNNKYLITTHSNAFLSSSNDVQIIHLWKKDNVTLGRITETSIDTLKILDDLGIKASDILQSNFVLWVEGPSDRIYIKQWLSLMDSSLKENIDYSIMFYGGKLLSHVGMERELPSPESFVQLLRINQRSAIVMDSDRDKPRARLNKTRKRILDECQKNHAFCWMTHGREIENYLPSHAVSSVYLELCGLEKEITIAPFDRLEAVVKKEFSKCWRSSYAYENHKPSFARKIAPLINTDDINNNPELKKVLNNLLTAIKGH